MSLVSVRELLVERLDQFDRGDRGWWILTRVHVSASWIKGIAEYLARRASGNGAISLTAGDFTRLATVAEIAGDDPGIQLRRHHLLVMDKPLQLLQRVKGQQWSEVVLTDLGQELARTGDAGPVFEECLSRIRFARSPWAPPKRIESYSAFDVAAYGATKEVLTRCEGYIDRNEFDFFVSRIRRRDEVEWAANAIEAYRALEEEDKDSLHAEVRRRVPSQKVYANWRDMGLHTFSLFSLGLEMVRDGTQLLLTSRWAGGPAASVIRDGAKVDITSDWLKQGTTKKNSAREAARTAAGNVKGLRIPVPPEGNELLNPPAAPAATAAAAAEDFVAKVLRSQGWQVAFYTNRRGYGFDLWARSGGRAMVVEVKSSVGPMGAMTFTPTEYRAAREHGEQFVLALVEHMATKTPQLTMIQNPAARIQFTERTSTSYGIARSEWLKAASN